MFVNVVVVVDDSLYDALWQVWTETLSAGCVVGSVALQFARTVTSINVLMTTSTHRSHLFCCATSLWIGLDWIDLPKASDHR